MPTKPPRQAIPYLMTSPFQNYTRHYEYRSGMSSMVERWQPQ